MKWWLRVLPPLALLFAVYWLMFHWRTRYTSEGPGGHQIKVQDFCTFPDCLLRVVVSKGLQSKEIADGNDCYMSFAHTTWAGSVAVVFVEGGSCPSIYVAYDVSADAQVDFEGHRAALAADIVRQYSVTPEEVRACGDDPLKWASHHSFCNIRSTQEFDLRHPQ